eukprot:gene2804-4212_t
MLKRVIRKEQLNLIKNQKNFYAKKKKRVSTSRFVPMDEIGKDVQNEYLKSYPKEHLPQPTIYDGPEILKVSYILDRNPICTHSEHPLEVEMGNEQQKEKSYYSRNKYHHFEDYFEAWKSEKDKLEKKLNKKKKKNQDFSGEFASIKVPDPKYSEKEKVEIFRLLGKKEGSKTATELLKKFNPMPRYTLDDLEDNRHSLNRKLMNNLYLIVKDKVSKKWKFPETIRKNPETLRLAIENKLLHDFNEKVYGKFLAHHPLCHLELSKDEKEKLLLKMSKRIIWIINGLQDKKFLIMNLNMKMENRCFLIF